MLSNGSTGLTFSFHGTESNESHGLRYRDENQEVFFVAREVS